MSWAGVNTQPEITVLKIACTGDFPYAKCELLEKYFRRGKKTEAPMKSAIFKRKFINRTYVLGIIKRRALMEPHSTSPSYKWWKNTSNAQRTAIEIIE